MRWWDTTVVFVILETAFFKTHHSLPGAGKTTLMSRMAANNITNFPTHLRCVYVRHEILLDQDISARNFLLSVAASAPVATSTASLESDVNSALQSVGFTSEMERKFVSTLSGGWRMRLAIGRNSFWLM